MVCKTALLVPMILAVTLPVAADAAGRDRSYGVWRNPQNSVHIRVEPCGKKMCGTVVWANDKAKRDAARGGTSPLVGAKLFRDFHMKTEGVWEGKVFVPDIGKTFSGTVSAIDDRHIKGKGCLVGGVLCKSQTWTRVDKTK